jgi:uncharacterized membrane protein YgaE (UPF0421/DUF939 family)
MEEYGMKLYERIHDWFYQTNMLWKSAVASSLAWETCVVLGISRPYLAPIAALLCLQVTIDDSVKRAYQRIIGTIIGVILTAFVLQKLGVHAWSIGFVTLTSSIFGRWLKLNDQIISQVGVSALLVFVLQNQNHKYPIERVEETIVGGIVAVVVNMLLFPPNYTKDALQSIGNYSSHLANSFEQLANWIKDGCPSLEGQVLHEDTQQLLEELHLVIENYEKAISSLKYNPLVQKYRGRLVHLNDQLIHLRQGYAHVSGMLRTLSEWSKATKIPVTDRTDWIQCMQLIANRIIVWQQNVVWSGQITGQHKPVSRLSASAKNTVLDNLPGKIEQNRYRYALYNDAIQTLEDFRIEPNT